MYDSLFSIGQVPSHVPLIDSLRPELQSKCSSEKLAKSGSVQDLKERLVCAWMERATSSHIFTWGGYCPGKAPSISTPTTTKQNDPPAPSGNATASGHAAVSGTATVSDAPSKDGDAVSAGSQPGAAAAGSEAAPSTGLVSGGACNSVLSKCETVKAGSKDMSSFFTTLNSTSPIRETQQGAIAEIVAAADVVVPVAAMVKICHTCSEDEHPLALLFGGQMCSFQLYIYISYIFISYIYIYVYSNYCRVSARIGSLEHMSKA